MSVDLPDLSAETIAMFRMMQFPDAVKRDPEIDAWLSKDSDELHAIAQRWFERMRRCGNDVRELMHDGCPVACLHDAAFAYVNVFTAHVNVGFFCGTELKDPAGLLEGTGKYMRHVKVRPGAELDSTALQRLIDEAYQYFKVRLLG